MFKCQIRFKASLIIPVEDYSGNNDDPIFRSIQVEKDKIYLVDIWHDENSPYGWRVQFDNGDIALNIDSYLFDLVEMIAGHWVVYTLNFKDDTLRSTDLKNLKLSFKNPPITLNGVKYI